MDTETVLISILIGVIAGLLGGILGIGGAIIIIPALVYFLGYSQALAQGTTLLMFVMPVGALAAFQYYKSGNVNINTALILGISFFVSGYFGAKLMGYIPQDVLKKVFALLLFIISIKMFFQK